MPTSSAATVSPHAVASPHTIPALSVPPSHPLAPARGLMLGVLVSLPLWGGAVWGALALVR